MPPAVINSEPAIASSGVKCCSVLGGQAAPKRRGKVVITPLWEIAEVTVVGLHSRLSGTMAVSYAGKNALGRTPEPAHLCVLPEPRLHVVATVLKGKIF